MNFYGVNFGEYRLIHSYDETYFEYFEFNGEKYPIGAHVVLNDIGMREMYHNGRYNYKKGDFRLVDHWIDRQGKERWEYIIGWSECKLPIMYQTLKPPATFVKEVIGAPFDETIYVPGELKVEFKEPNYFPKDNEVDGVIGGWIVLIVVWLLAFIFKDWWITLLIQISACLYFGKWRDNKINEAIRTQKFKE